MTTIGLVANVYNEVNALPGWIKTHRLFFDDIRVLHAGPNGEYSNDGTIELLEKYQIPHEFCAIDEGFGAVRTRAIRMSPCDYVMILDADERFYPEHKIMKCTGNPTSHTEVDEILRTYDFRNGQRPDWNVIGQLGKDLKVEFGEVFDQGVYLKNLIKDKMFDAIISIRRHWHDFTFTRPTQDWISNPDWQMRIIRNKESISFDTSTRMHERLVGAEITYRADMIYGPFFDHFHFPFKQMEQDQRSHDVDCYDRIHEGVKPRTWEEFKGNLLQ